VQRFWDAVIEPVLSSLGPSVLVEVGAQHGGLTDALLGFARDHDAVLHCVDPAPQFDVAAREAEFGAHFVFYETLSLNALGTIDAVDAVLIDGDHNWYTVRNELGFLARTSGKEGRPFPLTFLHDTGWPYGRRDLYYDPTTIPVPYLLPHRQGGVRPGSSNLLEGEGLNPHLDNAIYEHDQRNGVLTAVEDFVAETTEPLRVVSLPGGHGLTLVVPKAMLEADASLSAAAERLESAEFAFEHARWCELGRVEQLIEAGERKRAVRRAEERAAELDAHLTTERERMRTAEAEVAAATARAAEVETAVATERERATELETAVATERERATELETAVATERERAVELETAVATEHERAVELETAVATERERATELETAVTAERKRAADVDAELASQRAAVAAAEKEVRRLVRGVEAANARTQALQSHVRAQELAIETAAGRLVGLVTAAERIATSEAWRAGHFATRTLRRLTFRSAKGAGAMPRLLQNARAAQEALVVAPSAEPDASKSARPANAPQGTRPAGAPQRMPAGTPAPSRPRVAVPSAVGVADTRPPRDLRGVLRDGPAEGPGTVDVVVCVHDALEDVHRCVTSLLERTTARFRLVVVDDGSASDTAGYLDRLVAENPAVTLLRNAEPPHGYTIAANIGLRSSTGDLVVLLNSDTVVTASWLDQLIAAAASDERIGVVGPLSNAASHQSVPRKRDGDDWAVNVHPEWLTDDGMGVLVASLPGEDVVDVPFLNGFCYAITRAALDAVGLFDEEHFATGYSEENDFSRRAAGTGFRLVVATRAYVFHAKSRSYGHESRRELAKRNYRTFLERHGEEEIRALVAELEDDPSLAAVRTRIGEALGSPHDAVQHLPRLRVDVVLPGMAHGGSGGSHSVYQEVAAMRSLGIEARILISAVALDRARATYADAAQLFTPYRDEAELAELTDATDVLVATHYKSVPLVHGLTTGRDDRLGAYYVQDYEPLFAPEGSEEAAEALQSYGLMAHGLLFAKTEWLRATVAEGAGVAVAKVQPSIDQAVFHPQGRRPQDGGPIRVAAMLRPRTPRRAPRETVDVLRALAASHGDRIAIMTFGCTPGELADVGALPDGARHLGVLGRDDVAELLRATDVFVDCSWYQAFGRTGLEAMACGATAVMPAAGGAGEFLRHEENGLLVDTADLAAVHAALAGLVDDPRRLAALQAAATATASRYSALGAALSEYALLCLHTARRDAQAKAVRSSDRTAVRL